MIFFIIFIFLQLEKVLNCTPKGFYFSVFFTEYIVVIVKNLKAFDLNI